MWLPFLALDSYVAFEYRDAVSPLVNGYGLYGLVVDPHRGVVEDVEDQYCVRCYLEFKVAPVCNIGMHHGPLLNPNRPFAKPKNIDSLNGFGIYRLLDEDTSRIQVFLIPARANQLNRRKPGKSALLNHSFEVIEERRGIFREHLLEMILTYPGRMSLPRQCFDDVHNRSKYTQKKSVNQITGSSNEIFPGWKLIVSSWSSAVGPVGTPGIINFNQEIPTSSRILIEAVIQSSPATTATIKFPVPLTIAAINGTGQGVLFDILSMYLGTNNTPGSIKLICSSVITGASGVQGMNVVVQSNNLSDVSDIIQIKGIYFKA